MNFRLILFAICLAEPAVADIVVAARTIPATTVLSAGDLALAAGEVPGALSDPAPAIGLEARVTLYAGRPVSMNDLGAPAVIERNQIVSILFRHGNLRITAEGRALGRGAVGDRLRVMNLASRNTLSGVVTEDGHIAVEP